MKRLLPFLFFVGAGCQQTEKSTIPGAIESMALLNGTDTVTYCVVKEANKAKTDTLVLEFSNEAPRGIQADDSSHATVNVHETSSGRSLKIDMAKKCFIGEGKFINYAQMSRQIDDLALTNGTSDITFLNVKVSTFKEFNEHNPGAAKAGLTPIFKVSD